jgi:small subunit ribosomal protein S3Ae
MAVGKNKRVSKGGKRGNKKKVVEAMSRKEWYDVVAPASFKTRQFTKTICNKSQAMKRAKDSLLGRVYEGCLADLNQVADKDAPFRKMKFSVEDIQGRNLLTQFHGMDLSADRVRSLVQKWGSLIEAVVEAKTNDGYVLRLFVIAFTRRQKGQLAKNTYAKTRLEKWARHRITSMIQKRLSKLDINQAVAQLSQDIISDALLKRCNPILPLRDLKIRKVKVTRKPGSAVQEAALLAGHGEVPASKEADPRVEAVAVVAETVEVAAE